MRDIRRYVKQLGESNFAFSDFFIESTYQSEQGKILPCYMVTKKGCEFIANKLTGVKGTKFTATYINRFHEMEDALEGKDYEKLIAGITENVEKWKTIFTQTIQNFMEEQSDRIDRLESKVETYIEAAGYRRALESQEEKSPKHKLKVAQNQFSLSERLRELNSEFSYLSEMYGVERRMVMHKIYRQLEPELAFDLDIYLDAYKGMTGRREACTIHAVAYFDDVYEKAMDLMEDNNAMEWLFG